MDGAVDTSAAEVNIDSLETSIDPALGSREDDLTESLKEFLNGLEDLPDDWFGPYLSDLIS